MHSSSTRPGTWSAARDEAFFRIVQAVFPAGRLEAATVLLASYDDVAAPAARPGLPEPPDRRGRSRCARPVPRTG